MKKIIAALIISIFVLQNISLCDEFKDEIYYKRQIQYQRYTYNKWGFYRAVKKKNHIATEAFLDVGYSPDSKWFGTPLIFYTIQKYDNSALKMFLSHSVDLDITSKNKNLLLCCIDSSNSRAIEILIKHNIDINKKYKSKLPLNYAIKKEQTKIVEILLNAGAKPDEETLVLIKNSKDEYLKSLFE